MGMLVKNMPLSLRFPRLQRQKRLHKEQPRDPVLHQNGKRKLSGPGRLTSLTLKRPSQPFLELADNFFSSNKFCELTSPELLTLLDWQFFLEAWDVPEAAAGADTLPPLEEMLQRRRREASW